MHNRTPSSQSLMQVAAKTHAVHSWRDVSSLKLQVGIAIVVVLEAFTLVGILLAATL